MVAVNTKNIKEFLIQLSSFVVSPLLAIYVYAKGISLNVKGSYYFMAYVFALWGAYYPPVSDRYRYREIYYTSEPINWDNLYTLDGHKDWLYNYLSYIFNNIGFSFELFSLLIIVICYSIYTWIFLDIVEKRQSVYRDKKIRILAWYVLLFSIRIYSISIGMRFGTASVLLVLSIYLWFTNRKSIAVFCYALSVFMHFSMLMLIPLYAISKIFCFHLLSTRLKVVIIIISALFFSSGISTILQLYNINLLANSIDAYINGEWNTENMLASFNANAIIFEILKIAPVFVLILFYLKDSTNTFFSSLLFSFILLLCISSISLTLLLRYSSITISLLCIYMLKDGTLSYEQLRKSLIIFIGVFLMYSYTYRRAIGMGYQFQAVICPISLISHHSYSDSWVYSRIDVDGDYR